MEAILKPNEEKKILSGFPWIYRNEVAKIEGEDGIKDQDWSLNAGRYVGVVIEDDGMTEQEFKDHMKSLNAEFVKLCDEAKSLEKAITENIKGLFGD